MGFSLHRALHDGMMVGRVFLVLTGACQFGRDVGGFTTNFIHSGDLRRDRTLDPQLGAGCSGDGGLMLHSREVLRSRTRPPKSVQS